MAAYDETDVLIIGSGPGGAGVAKKLAAAGMRVVCLEQGPWVKPSEHPHYHDEWEMEKQRGWAYDPNVRQLPEDYPVTGTTTPYMMNNVGGSTMHYAGHWPRYKPVDFRKGTEHGLEGTIDWPISYEDLAPFYDENDAVYGISGLIGDPSYPDRKGAERDAPVLPGKLGIKYAKASQELGWHWWPSDNAIITEPRENRDADLAMGNELSGSPTGSLSTPAVAHWPYAIRDGADLRTMARVERINASGGRATGATYIDRRTGARHEVRAQIVVLAANGIGSPRLLLASAQNGHPDGLANANGIVGKYSVLNKWNQTWDLPNLFVVDGSALTTGGAVNPTSTIGALAVRCGEYITRRFDDITSQRTTPSNADAPDL